ncbi:squalene/phytoene synthase family protein [Pseudonocardia sp. TMWB2A]|uniref:squalene/phytoene synthase family protein n=1 Tax=Pseudonocardia sp. TMWB2A TaxID=687430 RepID=UPI00307FC99A
MTQNRPFALDMGNPLIRVMVKPRDRQDVYNLWQYDAELGQIMRAVRDPTLRAMRYIWWRDQIDGLADGIEAAHPVLEGLKQIFSPNDLRRLACLADIWADFSEYVPLGLPEVIDFSTKRGHLLFATSAQLMGSGGQQAHASGGQIWALGDVASQLSDAELSRSIWAHIRAEEKNAEETSLPYALRALTALSRKRAESAGKICPLSEQMLLFRMGMKGG